MSLDMAGLGLQPDPEGGETAPAEPAPAATTAPEPPAAPATTAAEPEVDEDIVVPEGAEHPDAVRTLIQAERKAAREAYKRARDAEAKLASIEEAGKPLEERLSLAQTREAEAKLETLRLRVGSRHGLPLTFSEMLRGEDEKSLEENAKSVLAELESRGKTPTVPGLSLNGGPANPAPTPSNPAQAHNNFLAGVIRRHSTGA